MTHLLAVFRLVLLLLLHAGVALLGGLVMMAHRLRPAWGEWARNRLLHLWSRGVVGVVGMRVEVSGTPPVPPFFLVANHLGYMDIIVLGTRLEATFVSKAEVAAWPAIGFLARVGRTVFVRRERRSDVVRAIELMRAEASAGHGVVFFPEGTSSRGRTVLPFQSSLFEAAVRARVDVHCASLSYHTPGDVPAAHRAIAWWGDMTFPGHFYGLLRVPRSRARVVFSDSHAPTDRRELARRTRASVLTHFRPTVEAPA